MSENVYDYNGTVIQHADSVRVGPDSEHARVVAISASDYDVDDDTGRGIVIGPKVTVQFNDATHGEYRAYQDGSDGQAVEEFGDFEPPIVYDLPRWVCEDVEVSL